MPSSCSLRLVVAALLVAGAAGARAQQWPDVYAPDLLLTLNLEIDPTDWDALRRESPPDPNDDTYPYTEYPARFWADGEPPLLVAVRKKRSRALPSESDPRKVGLKIDVDQYVTSQDWHGVTKLSLENGGEGELLEEGLSWCLHARARPVSGLGNWVRLVVNGQPAGVFVSAEQPGKRFLRNRNLHFNDQTWLYKHRFDLKVGGPGDSPAVGALCYAPFASGCPTPDPATLARDLPLIVDVPSMLGEAAADAFVVNVDGLFAKPNNYYFADYSNGFRRLYFAWDQDTTMGDAQADVHAWGPRSPTQYQSILLGNPTFRPQYDAILASLVRGELSAQRLMALVDTLEITLTDALEADPNAGLGDVAAAFDDARAWLCERVDSVRTQLGLGGVPACVAIEDCTDGSDDDGDARADCADSDCADHPTCLPESRCQDGIDNDDDGQLDCLDADCLLACFPEADCNDGVDDNGNGLTDCADPSCSGDPACPESNCLDGLDDDGDGDVDCEDSDCAAACNPETNCVDGLDDDNDGAADCLDTDCAASPACLPERECANGLDDDGDGAADCLDPDCLGNEDCLGEWSCSDGVDNDGDGDVDCADPNCIGDPACPETECGDAEDDDGDTLADCRDPDCFGIPPCDDGDGDTYPDPIDCDPLNGTVFGVPDAEVVGLRVGKPVASPTSALVSWVSLAPDVGSGVEYDVAGGRIGELRADTDFRRIACVFAGVADAMGSYEDARLLGVPSDGHYYLVRGRNSCGTGPLGVAVPDPCP